MVQVIRSRLSRELPINHPTPSHDDTLTYIPVRRSRRRSYRTPTTSPRAQEPITSAPSSIEPLFPSTRTVYAIPSGPDSVSTVGFPGRARTVAGRTRYHLPYDWIETRHSPDFSLEDKAKERRGSPNGQSQVSDPSPIHFASPSEADRTRESSRVNTPALSAEMEKDTVYLKTYGGFYPDGRFTALSEDAISGSLRWTRRSEDSTGVKSELIFAKYGEDDEYDTAMIPYEERAFTFRRKCFLSVEIWS